MSIEHTTYQRWIRQWCRRPYSTHIQPQTVFQCHVLKGRSCHRARICTDLVTSQLLRHQQNTVISHVLIKWTFNSPHNGNIGTHLGTFVTLDICLCVSTIDALNYILSYRSSAVCDVRFNSFWRPYHMFTFLHPGHRLDIIKLIVYTPRLDC